MEMQSDVLLPMMRLAGRFRREFAQLMAKEQWAVDANLRPGCFGVLRHVAREPGVSQQAVADRLGIPPSDVVALVDRLQDAGYVGRERDVDDRRRNVLTITPEGRRAMERFMQVAVRAEERVLKDVPHAERAELVRALSRVVGRLD